MNIKTDQPTLRKEFKGQINQALARKVKTTHQVWAGMTTNNDSCISVFVPDADRPQVLEIAKTVFGKAFHFTSETNEEITIFIWGWLPEAVFELGADTEAIMSQFRQTRGRLW